MFRRILSVSLVLVMAFTLGACVFNNQLQQESTTQLETPGPQQDVSTNTAQNQEPVSYPVALYLPNNNADGFKTKAAMTDGSAADIVDLLVQEGALPAGCAVLDFTVVSATSCAVDMNAAYGQAVTNTGTAGEYLRVGCLVNTLLMFYELDELVLTVEGDILETGHALYDQPLHFYTNF